MSWLCQSWHNHVMIIAIPMWKTQCQNASPATNPTRDSMQAPKLLPLYITPHSFILSSGLLCSCQLPKCLKWRNWRIFLCVTRTERRNGISSGFSFLPIVLGIDTVLREEQKWWGPTANTNPSSRHLWMPPRTTPRFNPFSCNSTLYFISYGLCFLCFVSYFQLQPNYYFRVGFGLTWMTQQIYSWVFSCVQVGWVSKFPSIRFHEILRGRIHFDYTWKEW